MNILLLRKIVKNKSGEEPLNLREADFCEIMPEDPDSSVRAYLTSLLVASTYDASGIAISGFKDLVENARYSPGSVITSFGFVVIGTTNIGGNSIVMDGRTGEVFWCSHESFSEVTDEISCPPPIETCKTGHWTSVFGYSRDNIRKALLLLEPGIEAFLTKCLSEEMRDRIDAID